MSAKGIFRESQLLSEAKMGYLPQRTGASSVDVDRNTFAKWHKSARIWNTESSEFLRVSGR
jgi:hypothetical protein